MKNRPEHVHENTKLELTIFIHIVHIEYGFLLIEEFKYEMYHIVAVS